MRKLLICLILILGLTFLASAPALAGGMPACADPGSVGYLNVYWNASMYAAAWCNDNGGCDSQEWAWAYDYMLNVILTGMGCPSDGHPPPKEN
jgi:hypothetical protein